MTDTDKELLPCPFCGWKSVVRGRNAHRVASGKHYFVRCPMCHTEGPRSTTSEALAIEKWNSRGAAVVAHALNTSTVVAHEAPNLRDNTADHSAATRRAIVRAAATIAKESP